MQRVYCDLCSKEITKDADNRHFKITKWDEDNHNYQNTTHHGDYHKKCVSTILKMALIEVSE